MINPGLKCLLVDDDEDDQEFFKEAIQEANLNLVVKTAKNGLEAMNVLESSDPPDCIFLDLNMPKMGGRECLKAIKDNISLNNVPVFILSTSSHAKDKSDMIERGAAGFITKPIQLEHLSLAIKHSLRLIGVV